MTLWCAIEKRRKANDFVSEKIDFSVVTFYCFPNVITMYSVKSFKCVVEWASLELTLPLSFDGGRFLLYWFLDILNGYHGSIISTRQSKSVHSLSLLSLSECMPSYRESIQNTQLQLTGNVNNFSCMIAMNWHTLNSHHFFLICRYLFYGKLYLNWFCSQGWNVKHKKIQWGIIWTIPIYSSLSAIFGW